METRYENDLHVKVKVQILHRVYCIYRDDLLAHSFRQISFVAAHDSKQCYSFLWMLFMTVLKGIMPVVSMAISRQEIEIDTRFNLLYNSFT